MNDAAGPAARRARPTAPVRRRPTRTQAGTPLRTEANLLRTLTTGTYTVQELYRRAERAGLADRPGGREVIQDGNEQYKRRVRSAIQGLRRQGRAHPAGDRAAWVIEGGPERPRRALLVCLLPGDPSQVELVLGAAADVLAQADEPIDLVAGSRPALRFSDEGRPARPTGGPTAATTTRWSAGTSRSTRPSTPTSPPSGSPPPPRRCGRAATWRSSPERSRPLACNSPPKTWDSPTATRSPSRAASGCTRHDASCISTAG